MGNNASQIVLYDNSAGEADVVGFNSNGQMNFDTTNRGWRKTWNMIVSGNLIANSESQILLYDKGAGHADVVGFNSNGQMNLDTTNSGWRKTWNTMTTMTDNQ